MLSQLSVLAGVVVGALASYLTTAATERARWKRELDSRWDDRRVAAYAAYAQAVKDKIWIASRIAAASGIGGASEPLPATEESFDLLASAEAARSSTWETVLLLGHPDTVAVARTWHEAAWRLEWLARGLIAGDHGAWEEARSAANEARTLFYESARNDLQVRGGRLPLADDYETRRRRIGGESAS